jgi:GGDEF domain-containing protein
MFMPDSFGMQLDSGVLSDTINDILGIAARLFTTRIVAVSRIEGTTCTVMALIDQQRQLRPGTILHIDDTFCVHMLEQNQPWQIDDAAALPEAQQRASHALGIPLQAYLGVPLRLPAGRVFGSLWAADSEPHSFSTADVRMLSLLARLLTYELEYSATQQHRKRIEQVMATQVNIDPLTGLFSREGFLSALNEEATWRHRFPDAYTVAVLALQMDTPELESSKAEVIHQGLADILMRTARLVDYCGRIDDATYAVLLPNTTMGESTDWQQRLRTEIDAWNRVHRSVDLTFDIVLGIADSHETLDWSQSSSAVLERAQQRMLESRRQP